MENAAESYKAAGVDVEAGYAGVKLIKPLVERTNIPGVVSEIGGFGGLFAPRLIGYQEPVFVSGTDGVGTKLRLAQILDKHDTVGIDCVAMCVNDIICSGAKPLFFLDYIAIGKNKPEKVAEIVSGVAEGCVQAGCALLGGETAEHPGVMDPEDYDLAGFAVGIVDRPKIIENRSMSPGDVLIALPSSGPHSNGFSLIRKVFDVERPGWNVYSPELGAYVGEKLLEPTKIYVKPLLRLLEAGVVVRGVSHITGGGFFENIPRCLPEGLSVRVEQSMIETPPIFQMIQSKGNIPEREMFATFNMGVGMVIIAAKENADKALSLLRSDGAYLIGVVTEGSGEVE